MAAMLLRSPVSAVSLQASGGSVTARHEQTVTRTTSSASALWGEQALCSWTALGGRSVGASVKCTSRRVRVRSVGAPRAEMGKQVDFDGGVTLQAARTWDQGVEGGFKTTSMTDIFKGKKVVIFGLPGAFTGVCTKAHVPSYINLAEDIMKKGVDKIICVSVNDPYTMNAWAEKLGGKPKLEFYGDFDGSFHKSLGLDKDLTFALLGPRSQRWSAYIVDGKVEALNVEADPSEFKVSDAETVFKSIN